MAQTTIHQLKEQDIVEMEVNGGSKIKFAQYISHPNIAAGFIRLGRGDEILEWPYWYEEVVYVTRGSGKITISPPPFTSGEPHDVKSGDLFYIGKGNKVTFQPKDEAFEFLYVTAPNAGVA